MLLGCCFSEKSGCGRRTTASWLQLMTATRNNVTITSKRMQRPSRRQAWVGQLEVDGRSLLEQMNKQAEIFKQGMIHARPFFLWMIWWSWLLLQMRCIIHIQLDA